MSELHARRTLATVPYMTRRLSRSTSPMEFITKCLATSPSDVDRKLQTSVS
jgi:hypothetical protein